MTTQQYYMKLITKKVFKIILPSAVGASNAVGIRLSDENCFVGVHSLRKAKFIKQRSR